MSTSMEEAPGQMSLTRLADLSTSELQRHRCQALFDDRYCLELFHHALIEQTDQAWCELQLCFSETNRRWIYAHPYQDVALLRDSEENYIAQTFSRFWCVVRTQQLEFATLYASLSYLHATLNGIIIDILRSHLRSRAREVPLPEPGPSGEPVAEDSIDSQSIWKKIQTLLPEKREND